MRNVQCMHPKVGLRYIVHELYRLSAGIAYKRSKKGAAIDLSKLTREKEKMYALLQRSAVIDLVADCINARNWLIISARPSTIRDKISGLEGQSVEERTW
jgi:hypothetical protein